MMKRYLNKDEKQIALVIAAFISYLEERIYYWAHAGRIVMAMMAGLCKAGAENVLDRMFENIDDGMRSNIIGELSKMEVIVKYKADAVKEYEHMKKMDEVTPMLTDDLFEISEHVINECTRCLKYREDADGCKIRALLLKYHIPVLNENAFKGTCPYQYKRGDGEK